MEFQIISSVFATLCFLVSGQEFHKQQCKSHVEAYEMYMKENPLPIIHGCRSDYTPQGSSCYKVIDYFKGESCEGPDERFQEAQPFNKSKVKDAQTFLKHHHHKSWKIVRIGTDFYKDEFTWKTIRAAVVPKDTSEEAKKIFKVGAPCLGFVFDNPVLKSYHIKVVDCHQRFRLCEINLFEPCQLKQEIAVKNVCPYGYFRRSKEHSCYKIINMYDGLSGCGADIPKEFHPTLAQPFNRAKLEEIKMFLDDRQGESHKHHDKFNLGAEHSISGWLWKKTRAAVVFEDPKQAAHDYYKYKNPHVVATRNGDKVILKVDDVVQFALCEIDFNCL